MRGLHGKRPGVQVERALEGACEGPRPSRGAVPGRGGWPVARTCAGGPNNDPPPCNMCEGMRRDMKLA